MSEFSMNGLSIELAAWLSDFYLLSTILLIAVLVAGKLVGQPARRIAISWAAALGLVVLAGLCAMPDWSTVHVSRPAPLSATAVALPSTPPLEIDVAPLPTTKLAAPAMAELPKSVAVVPAQSVDWKQIATHLMASGSAVVLMWLMAGAWQARRLRGRAVSASAVLTAMLAELTPEGQTAPQIGILAELPVAVAIGVRKPMILLPRTLADMSQPEKLQSVLAHELAHIEHRDLSLLALLRGLLVVLWAHPLLWIWHRQVRLDQETLADAAAAEVTSRTNYAEQLVTLARETASVGRRLPLASSVGLWENASQLKRRVAVLLDEKMTVLRACSRRWRIFSVLSLAAVTFGLSLVTLQPDKVAVAESPSKPTTTETSSFGVAEQLNNGTTVELLAIGTHGRKTVKWWNAKGRLLTKLPFEAQPATNISPQPNGQLVFRVRDLSEDGDVKWKTIPASNTGEGSVVVNGEKNPRGYFHHAFVLPKRGKKFSLRVGVAAGKWTTMAKGKSGAMGIRVGILQKSVVFSRALMDVSGSTVVIVSHNYHDAATRVVAIDKSGKEHLSTSHSRTSAGKQNQTQLTFEGLWPEGVDKFAFQARPYEWAEFKELPSGLESDKELSQDEPSNSGYDVLHITELLKVAEENGIIQIRKPAVSDLWEKQGIVANKSYSFEPNEVSSLIEPVFDKQAGYEKAWEVFLEGLERDPYGPKVNLSKDFFGKLSGVLTLLADASQANRDASKVWLVLAQASDVRGLRATIFRWMRSNLDATLINIADQPAWKIKMEENQNVFICVSFGHLFISNKHDLLIKALVSFPAVSENTSSSR